MTERTPRYGPPVPESARVEAAALLAQAIMAVGRANKMVPGVEAVEDALEAVERAYRDDEFTDEREKGAPHRPADAPLDAVGILRRALSEYVERHEQAAAYGGQLRGLPEYDQALRALELTDPTRTP